MVLSEGAGGVQYTRLGSSNGKGRSWGLKRGRRQLPFWCKKKLAAKIYTSLRPPLLFCFGITSIHDLCSNTCLLIALQFALLCVGGHFIKLEKTLYLTIRIDEVLNLLILGL